MSDLDALADELQEIIVALESTPDNVGLLKRQIKLMRGLDMKLEAIDYTLRLSALVMLDDGLWSEFFDELLTAPVTLESFVQILEHFDTAEKDYFSTALLVRHAKFIIQCTGSTDLNVDEAVIGFLTPDTVRRLLESVYTQAVGNLGLSERVWNLLRDWEMGQLSHTDDRATQLERIHSLFLERLRTPHINSEATAASYSTFCTENDPEGYEGRMVTATSSSQVAKAKLSGERRHGRTREDYEQQISIAQDPMSQIPSLVEYMDWEMDPKAKISGTHGPVIDPLLIRSVSERTIAAYALAANQGPLENSAALKDGEAAIWSRYISWLRSAGKAADAAEAALRATRACPQSPSLWCTLLQEMERQHCLADDMTAAFERAQDLGAMFTEGSTAFIDVFVCRAAQQYRLLTAEGENDTLDPIFETAERGFALLDRLNKAGDPSLKLEKFLLDWAETRAPSQLEKAIALVEKPLRSRTCSYQFVLLKAGLECRRGDAAAARQLYYSAIQRSDLDWPEAVYEAFIQFEDVHGDIYSMLQTRNRITKETQKLARRREKQQEQLAAEYAEQTVAQQSAAGAAPEAVSTETAQVEIALTSDAPVNEVNRNREHTTVLVDGLAKGTSQSLVESFFESCGRVREITVLAEESRPVDAAMVEFRDAESVGPALAKHRRKLDGQEITVAMLWRSTLFITNFPPDFDDAQLRSRFSQYGHIFQTRWPSRKFDNNRRFCYVTMDSSASAESALAMDGYRLDADSPHGLSVKISDPAKKNKRSDETYPSVFVGGLDAKTTEQDVRDLFGNLSIKSLKMPMDPVRSVCKGFAFVYLSSEADFQEALKVHGTSHRGRKLKVEKNDTHHANKKASSDAEMNERRSRTVRLNDVPHGMQEALLQQALQKIVPVRRLELFTKTHHAQAELENQADVGRLLLRAEPFVVEGSTITITEHARRPNAASAPGDKKAKEVVGDSLSFAPRVAKRPGKTLGKGRHAAPLAPTGPSVASSTGNAQDAFRAVVDAKNKQREGNLETTRSKRPLEQATGGEESGQDKRTKSE